MKSIFYFTYFLSFSLSSLALPAPPCNPIGQFTQLGGLTNDSIGFLNVLGEPNISSAQINTAACANIRTAFSKDDYMHLQDLTASAIFAFVLVEKNKNTNNISCLTKAISANEITDQVWRFEDDKCSQEPINLKKIISLDGRSSFYMNFQQASFLINRGPASSKQKKSKK